MLFLLHCVDLIYPVSCGRPHHFLLLGIQWWGGPHRRSPARARGQDERPRRRRRARVRSSSSTRPQLDPLLSATRSTPLLQGHHQIPSSPTATPTDPLILDNSKHYGVNFAVASTTAIEHDFFAKNNPSLDIMLQSMTELGWFDAHLKTCGAATKKDLGEALFWVGEIGANNFAYSFMAADSIPPERIRTMAVDRVTTFLEVTCTRSCMTSWMVMIGTGEPTP